MNASFLLASLDSGFDHGATNYSKFIDYFPILLKRFCHQAQYLFLYKNSLISMSKSQQIEKKSHMVSKTMASDYERQTLSNSNENEKRHYKKHARNRRRLPPNKSIST